MINVLCYSEALQNSRVAHDQQHNKEKRMSFYRRISKWLLSLLYLLSSCAWALENAPVAASVALARKEQANASGLTDMVLSLFILLAIIGALYWFTRLFLARRLGLGNRMQSMRVLSVTMLGPKEKIVVVDTRQGDVLVVGVTAHQISLLDKRPLEGVEEA